MTKKLSDILCHAKELGTLHLATVKPGLPTLAARQILTNVPENQKNIENQQQEKKTKKKPQTSLTSLRHIYETFVGNCPMWQPPTAEGSPPNPKLATCRTPANNGKVGVTSFWTSPKYQKSFDSKTFLGIVDCQKGQTRNAKNANRLPAP